MDTLAPTASETAATTNPMPEDPPVIWSQDLLGEQLLEVWSVHDICGWRSCPYARG